MKIRHRKRKLTRKSVRQLTHKWTVSQGPTIMQYGVDLVDFINEVLIAEINATRND